MKDFIQQQLLPFVNPVEWIRAMRESRAERRQTINKRKEALEGFRRRIGDLVSKAILEKAQLSLFPSVVPQSTHEHRDFVNVVKEMVAWSDSDLVTAHDGMVKDALIKLRDTVSKTVRRELFQWFAPDAHHEQPFSFESCCAIAGLDADNIRRQVLRLYRDEIVGLIAEEQKLVASGKTIIQEALATEV
jgi:hypothetical protein